MITNIYKINYKIVINIIRFQYYTNLSETDL